jgi:hypothetical protein
MAALRRVANKGRGRPLFASEAAEQHRDRTLVAAQRVGLAGGGRGRLGLLGDDDGWIDRLVGLGKVEAVCRDRGAAAAGAGAHALALARRLATAAVAAAVLGATFATGRARCRGARLVVRGCGRRPAPAMGAAAGLVEVGVGVEAGDGLLRDLQLDQLLDLG